MSNGQDLRNSTMMRKMASGRFDEASLRQTIAQLEAFARAQGGQMGVSDPITVLSLGIVMDKLNEI